MIQSLKRQKHKLSTTEGQLQILSDAEIINIIPFEQQMEDIGHLPLKPIEIDIFQINVGKMCNQVCSHCHVDAGPDRKEIMTRETMQECLNALKNTTIETVDLTGGAPEMNPNFRWFVEEISKLGKKNNRAM